ncbi:hypothetical protein VOLCADRAFT_94220 [Volvox carteri f. nagariensis]|uniref:gamma-glutamylcyclotransferase n=1 Tax=Volvox carteri f. nagariensis TaxID=3068 RepID=D8U4G3_VOLCA|nr:uncharacterized protein VOLCADRAFT_94220 [Volvox carteri f. nagariensis]EFJ45496.1 hypothetical protein VOLCADRAFT_94220 [Volvox carteri f. nagariensis]|eukprot:XP_002953523.1 hypothetical protein VOLCADRAFT_94220 [Volvox carteri f. nagariensis]
MHPPQQCVSNHQHHDHSWYHLSVAHQQSRTCLARAQRGRGAGRAMSAWAWPGPLSWRDGSAKQGQDPSTRSPSPSSSARVPPPPQPVTAGQRGESLNGGGTAEPIGDTHAGGTGTITATNTSGNSGDRQPTATQPAAGPNPQPRLPPRQPQLQASGADTVITFAYGANMNFLTLARREVRVLSRDPAFVVDPSIRLMFKHQGGYATLERAEEGGKTAEGKEEPRFRPYDGRVHGVLYRVTRADFEKLAKREGGYIVQEVQVQTYDGSQYTALAFVSNPLFKLPAEVLPAEKYLARVREGARDNYLDPAYQAFLSGISTVPGAGLGSEYYNTPSKYMGYSFLVVVALITLAFFFQH